VVIGLTRTDGIVVYGPELRQGIGADLTTVHDLPVEFVLTGGITASEKQIRVLVSLVDMQTGRYVWSHTFERDVTAGNLLAARESIGTAIVQTLVQPNSVLRAREDTAGR
jgi:TolB-like protein